MPKAKPPALRPPAAAGPPAGAPAPVPPSGSRRPTINDIARLANVSKKTVSRVINQSPFVKGETRARIDAVIQEIGYTPDPQARGLAFRRSFLIGMVYDNPNAQYIVNIQDGALDALRGSGFELVVHPCDRRSDDFISGVRSFVERQKLHGVILIPPVSENDELVRTLQQTDCQYVRVASVCLDNTARMIVSNDFEATVEVAEHLASLGHRRIGVIAGPSQHRSSHERLRGFLGALEKRGMTVPADLIAEGAFTFESGVACAEALLKRRQRPTAIFACNDEMAAGVYKTAFNLRVSIPDELSVVGFDDSPLASRLTPALTTVRLPIREMGRLAAARLISPQATDEGAARMNLHLVVRDSSRAL
ncbi:MAG TPA: LacI family DNA-binding transcriptional regulator [Steroidobacteraceae bacterium]|jgi:LacI family transcriptional regulator